MNCNDVWKARGLNAIDVRGRAALRPQEAAKQRQTSTSAEQPNTEVVGLFSSDPQVGNSSRTWLAAKGSGVRVPSAPPFWARCCRRSDQVSPAEICTTAKGIRRLPS